MASLIYCALSELHSWGGDLEDKDDYEFINNIVGFINNKFTVSDEMEYDKEKLIEYIRNN
jgi:hypothetical protein